MKRTIVAAAAAMWLVGCGSSPAPESTAKEAPAASTPKASSVVTMNAEAQTAAGVKVTTVNAESVPEVIRATAKLTNDENRTWRVGSVAEGRIARVHVNPGDIVKKDEILAEMHSHDIHESRAAYKKAKADFARLQGVEEYRLKLKDRAKRLLDLRAGSVAQYEQAETEWKNSQTDVQNAEIEIEKAVTHLVEVLGIPVEEADVPQRVSGEDNDLIPIKAPSGGVVLTRSITPGTVVTPSTDLFVVSDLANLWAVAEVNEEYLGKLRIGMPVRIYVQAYPNQPFFGKISKLGELLDPGTRTIKVRIDLQNAVGKLKPEMYADAEIELGRGGTALMLPADAIQDLRGEPVVFVKLSNEKFEVRPVQTGRTIGNEVEILSGLRAGDNVVTVSAFILKSEFLKASLSEE